MSTLTLKEIKESEINPQSKKAKIKIYQGIKKLKRNIHKYLNKDADSFEYEMFLYSIKDLFNLVNDTAIKVIKNKKKRVNKKKTKRSK